MAMAWVRGGGLVFLVATSLSGHAPYQCGKSTDRSVREETPGEALYALAQKLKAEGDDQGYKTTLRYLVSRYPSSRFATAAQVDLGAEGFDGGPR
jgi:outer membrane protein assembly factor BamD (BamD/ComL family)